MKKIRVSDDIFFGRVYCVLLATGCAFLVGSLMADYYWSEMFEAIYGASVAGSGVAGRETDPAVVAEYATLKPLLNLTMYLVPTTLGFLGAGMVLTGAVFAGIDALTERWQAWRQRCRSAA
ncbi:hypothetical protein HT886_003941 [Salmonella enterica]|nr:hypothetical protein [Salmonella enterica]EBG3528016.1 hypothetical protein [Salmonella enterica subsp. enterica]EBR8224006.1 hypothetical protein [Salmonella enterica subsp. enterica serovar Oranienburg]EBU7005559.1 hypothetical protein [Salmonella enterica subsp. enterica serovar Kintambo]EBV9368673.1 hypothetical protein [Salmonella enterica subsp. enterica serovar Sandiego]ECG4881166.1 hypothetical protein [Salmonella enterica subsp. enterica serovar Schwarzengrund]ECT6635822.1 hypothe